MRKMSFFWIIYTFAHAQPFTVKTNLYDQSNPETLGLSKLPGTETFTVFKPSASTDHFSNGAVLVSFHGTLYCQWQSSAQNEDSPDTWVAYSKSLDNGKTWTIPETLSAPRSDGYTTSGGWWINRDTLVAYINFWPDTIVPKGGFTWYRLSVDGKNWSSPRHVLMADQSPMRGIFEQDPHTFKGRLIGAAHFQPGLIVSPIYTDDLSGVRGWKKASFSPQPHTGNTSREMEPSWFSQKNGTLIMLFRDQSSTFLKLASSSIDQGLSWSTPQITNMPDSRSKQCAGNLPDGSAFMIHNPVNDKRRYPLVLTISRDGQTFTHAYVLRSGGADLQEQRYTGTAKTLGYNYPKALIYGEYLYVSYTTNKEDVEISRVPLASICTTLGNCSTVAENSFSRHTSSHTGKSKRRDLLGRIAKANPANR